MSDILAVFGILLAVFTYIESLYHDEIHQCLDFNKKDVSRDNKLNYERVEKTIKFKQYPLVAIGIIISIVMLPVSIDILKLSILYIVNDTAVYDISSISVLLINIAFIIISIIQVTNLSRLYKKKNELNYK